MASCKDKGVPGAKSSTGRDEERLLGLHAVQGSGFIGFRVWGVILKVGVCVCACVSGFAA